jgi:hypothetical protein
LLCCLIQSCAPFQAAAQDVRGGQTKVTSVAPAAAPPKIDGLLDDAIWQSATVVEDLHQVNPDEFSEPSEPTTFYLLYDKDALYIAARVFDSRPDRLTDRVLRQGAGLRFEDRIAVVLDTFNDRRNGYTFELNANGVREEGLWKNSSQFGPEWVGIWEGHAMRTAEGWTAEIAIPAKTLSFDAGSHAWGFNLWRSLQRNQETMAWQSHDRQTNPSTAGVLTGLEGLDQGLGLDVVPALSLGKTRTYSPRDSAYHIEPSLDVFYKLTPGLNASLTLNTDFSGTEVDDRQINLSRFSLFFPEKRAFFLQDFDIFEFGRIGGNGADGGASQNGRPFFSRKIGLSADGQPVDIDYGGKLSGRIGEWNIGALAIRQAGFRDVAADTLLVGRVTRNVLSQSALGVIFTHGDPSSNLDNTLFGIDFRYRNTELGRNTLEGEAWYQQSDTDGLHGADAAWGLRLGMPNSNRWFGEAGVRELQANFRPALGFANQTGIREYSVLLGYRHRPAESWVRALTGESFYRRVDRLDGPIDTEELNFGAYVENHTGDESGVKVLHFREGLIVPFEIYPGVVVAAGEYRWQRWGFDVSTGPQRKLGANFVFRDGAYYDGERLHLEGALRWAPSKHFVARARFDYNAIDLPHGDFITRLFSANTEVVFSNTLAWISLLQYDNVTHNFGIHSRVHWIPRAGREMFFVINHNLVEESEGFRSTSSDITVKASYTIRF